MSRWDDSNFDNFRYEDASEHEEARLLKKFEDYRELEKIELDKRISPKSPVKEKQGDWTNRFIFLTIIQAIIISGFTISLMLMESVNSEIKIAVLLLTLCVLGGEIIFLSKYLQKKSVMRSQKVSIQYENKTEFDGI